MASQPLGSLGLKLQLEQKPNDTIVHCKGKITAENSEMFQREIRDLIPQSHAQIAAITYRIVLDLSNVTHVDSAGLGALLRAWTAAQSKGCELEIANLNPQVVRLQWRRSRKSKTTSPPCVFSSFSHLCPRIEGTW